MLLGMSKQLVYTFPGFYNKETISSNNLSLKLIIFMTNCIMNSRVQLISEELVIYFAATIYTITFFFLIFFPVFDVILSGGPSLPLYSD